MTKVIKNIVKCSKCGKESEQLIICSVNYLLGTKEDNHKLINHKQKCPYCNYEAVDIGILNNKLERNKLEKITEQFISDINKHKSNVYEYEFIPYRKIGNILLDKLNEKEFQPNGVPFLYENEFNHVLCRAITLDHPENVKRTNGNIEHTYIICDNEKIKLTCVFEKFIESLNQICDDLVIIEDNVETTDNWKTAYSKKLGIFVNANQFKDDSNYYIQSIHFTGKDVFNGIITEIFSTKVPIKLQVSCKSIYTLDQTPWIDYLEIDEETNERKLRIDTPEEIKQQYNNFLNNKINYNDFIGDNNTYLVNIKKDDYLFISSNDSFSNENVNNCFVSLNENKIYNYVFGLNNIYEYYKDLTNNEKEKLMKYINDNDLLNFSDSNQFNSVNKFIDISLSGKKKQIRIADNELCIFNDIVDIVLDDRDDTMKKNNILDDIKNKYNVKEENNRPQIVYGIPDDMRKKWEKEKEIEIEIEHFKYDVEPEENVPQFVYGIPDYFRYQNENNIFEAFEGGYFGPSSHYYIDLIDNDRYEFKYGYSGDGRRILNDSNSDELFITKHNKEFYGNFIQELKNMTVNWKNSYVDENVMDGTQWNLDIKSINKSFSGSNAFPENYNEVKSFLDRMFNVDMYNMQKKYNVEPEDNVPYEVYGIPDANLNKYDISPEDNIPQRIYGIPNPNISNSSNQNNNSIYKESIVFKIKKEDKNYALMINKRNETEASITFCDASKISEMNPSDIGVRLSGSFYNKIRRQMLEIVSNWDNQYIGNKDCEWSLNVTIDDSSECAIGKGEYPENWNEFIELMSKYELLYKKLLINNKSKVELFNRKDKPIEEFVKDKVKDSESCKLILDNLNKELGTSNYMKVLAFVDLCKYEDILNEYIECLKINNEQFFEHLQKPISIKGYDAKQLKELNNKFNITGLYTFMELLRDDFITAKKILDSNFTYNPIKDKLEKNSSAEEEKCPYCGSNELYKYLYGEPTFDYDKEKYVLGGCEIGLDRPIYKCKKCGNDIGKNFNPFDEAVEIDFDIELLKKTIGASEREDFCTTNVASKFVDGTPFTYGSSLCEELSAFYKYLYDNNFIDLNYLDNNELIKNKEIDKLTFEEVMTKLTFPHRAERFCDGAMYSFVKSGDMKKCLKRLLNILEKES